MFLHNSALLLTKGILVGETPAFLFGKSHFVRGVALHSVFFGSVIAFTAYS
jgi:hypothetical protein